MPKHLDSRVQALLRVLSRPHAQLTLDALRLGDRTTAELIALMPVGQEVMAKAIFDLEQAGLVCRVGGPAGPIRLRPEALAPLREWLSTFSG